MDDFEEYILDCRARNLREGTIHHYEESIKQIFKRIPPDTPISSMNKQILTKFYIALRQGTNLNEVFIPNEKDSSQLQVLCLIIARLPLVALTNIRALLNDYCKEARDYKNDLVFI